MGIEPQAPGPSAEVPPEKLEALAREPERRERTPFPVVHPSLREEAKTSAMLDVYVFLASGSGSGDAGLRSVRERYLPALRDLSQQIRRIERRYRPTVSIPSDQEDAWAGGIEAALSRQDREESLRLRLELDAGLHVMRRELAAAIRKRVGPSQEEVAAVIEGLGGRVEAKVLTSNVLLAVLPAYVLDELGAHPNVRRIVPRREGQPCLDSSVPSCG
jgi:hypothetical protein